MYWRPFWWACAVLSIFLSTWGMVSSASIGRAILTAGMFGLTWALLELGATTHHRKALHQKQREEAIRRMED